MSNWKVYSWADFDPFDLPWAPQSEHSVMPLVGQLGKDMGPADRSEAAGIGFDPNHTYYTTLVRGWQEHPVGSRVLLETTEIAIEARPPVPAT